VATAEEGAAERLTSSRRWRVTGPPALAREHKTLRLSAGTTRILIALARCIKGTLRSDAGRVRVAERDSQHRFCGAVDTTRLRVPSRTAVSALGARCRAPCRIDDSRRSRLDSAA
jgi:hypothetical protein